MVATVADIPQLARLWYQSKPETCFGGAVWEWSTELCALHLEEVLSNPAGYLVVEKDGTKITAACGVLLLRPIIPPHPLTVVEYLWYGSNKRGVVRTLKACLAWGKSQGAQYASYTLNRAQNTSRKWVEEHQWRAL